MDSDDYSDLTDIEDDDYKSSKAKKSNKAAGGSSGYRIRHALKVPRATTYTAQALYDQIHSSDINLEPEYQRAVVWPESKQIGLIDSVFRNFYIPPVIFAVIAYEDGSESKTCIDGKQRLTSIHRFMDGLIPHKDPYTGEKLWYKDAAVPSSSKRKLLPEKYRRLFANKQIVCVEYADINDSDEREIFQRVQLGMALTPAEKLQVINTPRAAFVRELQKVYIDEDGGLSGDNLEWDKSRGGDFRCLAQTVHLLSKWPGSTTVSTIPQLEKWLSSTDPLPDSLASRAHEIFSLFRTLVNDSKLNKVFKKPAKISPVEFVVIPILIGACHEKMSMPQLSAAIGKLREDVREHHVDIRMNNRVSKWLLEYISNLAEGGGDTKEPAKDKGKGKSSTGDKRKREDDSSSDGEYKPSRSKSSTASKASSANTVRPTASSAVSAMPNTASSTTTAASTLPPRNKAAADRLAAVRMAKELAASMRPNATSPTTSNAASGTASVTTLNVPPPRPASSNGAAPSSLSFFLPARPNTNTPPILSSNHGYTPFYQQQAVPVPMTPNGSVGGVDSTTGFGGGGVNMNAQQQPPPPPPGNYRFGPTFPPHSGGGGRGGGMPNGVNHGGGGAGQGQGQGGGRFNRPMDSGWGSRSGPR